MEKTVRTQALEKRVKTHCVLLTVTPLKQTHTHTTFSDWKIAHLSILEHPFEVLLHLFEFARLNSTVGQQHSSKLLLCDPAVHWIIPLKLHTHTHTQREGTLNNGLRSESCAQLVNIIYNSCSAEYLSVGTAVPGHKGSEDLKYLTAKVEWLSLLIMH